MKGAGEEEDKGQGVKDCHQKAEARGLHTLRGQGLGAEDGQSGHSEEGQ